MGKPKPVGKWLKHGTEIIPSDEFIIENFDDGTSVLILPEVYPDDTGEIVFEAHNPLGVAVTVTELSVESKFCSRFIIKIIDNIMLTFLFLVDLLLPFYLLLLSFFYTIILKTAPNTIKTYVPLALKLNITMLFSTLGIVGTKEYRKPEWVTHMEELQAALKGNNNHETLTNQHVGVPQCLTKNEQGNVSSSPNNDRPTVSQTLTPDIEEESCTSYNYNAYLSPLKTHSQDDIFQYDSSGKLDPSMIEYLNLRRHSHCSTREFLSSDSLLKSQEKKSSDSDSEFRQCLLRTYYSQTNKNPDETTNEIDEEPDLSDDQVIKDNFFVLSPIEENSERAETESPENVSVHSSNNSGEKIIAESITIQTTRLLSHSWDNIPTIGGILQENKVQYQTLPKAKLPSTRAYRDYWSSFRFPTEPRELDPAAYHQLHTADSQEELQEFLLLESVCMDGQNNGLASAFTMSDEGPKTFGCDDSCDDRGTVSGIAFFTNYFFLYFCVYVLFICMICCLDH